MVSRSRLYLLSITLVVLAASSLMAQANKRPRAYGIPFGVLPTGPLNAITDVAGVRVGQVTLQQGPNVRTGVTAILPHSGNLFGQKSPAAIYIGNGFGKLTGYSQVEELGTLETPIILTNTLSVPTAADAVIDYTLSQPGNEQVRSVNPVVGETNDGFLNDIRGRHLTKQHVLDAIRDAKTGPVAEGNVGAGTGTVCFGYKGGMGTSSRKLPASLGGYTVGALVQTNFGGVLQIAGMPVKGKMNGIVGYLKAKDANFNQELFAVPASAPVAPTTAVAINPSPVPVSTPGGQSLASLKENFVYSDFSDLLEQKPELLDESMALVKKTFENQGADLSKSPELNRLLTDKEYLQSTIKRIYGTKK